MIVRLALLGCWALSIASCGGDKTTRAKTSVEAPSSSAAADPLGHLQGHWGFVSTMAGGPCDQFDAVFLAALRADGASCTAEPAKTTYGIAHEAWHSCTVGDNAYMVFRSKQTCDALYNEHRTRLINAP